MRRQHAAGREQREQRHVGAKRKRRDGDGGAHRLEPELARQHAVDRPAKRRAHEDHIALPHAAAVEGLQQACAAHHQIAHHDAGQPQRACRRDGVAQHQRGQQRRPQRQAARHQHRGVRRRRVEKTRVAQHRVDEAAEKARQHRLAQRQRRQAQQRRRRRIAPPARKPPAPGQQHRAGAQHAQQADVERQQRAPGRRTADDDEPGPDGHRDHGRRDAGRTGRKTHEGIIGCPSSRHPRAWPRRAVTKSGHAPRPAGPRPPRPYARR